MLATNRHTFLLGFHVKLLQVVTRADSITAYEAMRDREKYGVPDLLELAIRQTWSDWRRRRSQATA